MDEKKILSNLNSSNKNTDEIINKIQNSLNRLQSAINNKQLLDNFNNDKINTQNKNINFRKRTIDNIKISRKNKPSYTEEKIQNIIYDNNSMFNINSVLNTDKRSTQKKMIQNRVLNTLNYDDDIINRTIENIIPKSTQRRNYYNKINYYNNNRNNYTNNGLSRKTCFKCRNINPPNSKFCFNCGAPVTNTIRNQYNTNNIKSNIKNNISNKGSSSRNIENLEENQNYPRTQIQSNNNYNKPKNNKIMNNIYEDLNDIQNENLINYKKLNDLYLFGDYLENELKVSNDENVKLLEQYKKMKIQVHSLNQKNNKIKQNIDALNKKEKYISKLNEELKNGFNFAKENLGNNEEKAKILNELESSNKKYIEIQTDYEKQIENLKNKISELVDNEEKEENEDDKIINKLEDDIENDKKELENKNAEYMLLIKKNELLNQEIINLGAELDMDLEENVEENEENLTDENNNDNNNNQKSNELKNEEKKN